MTVFHDCYRVETARLCGKDYAEAGTYFVTVCTKDRKDWFGEVCNERMMLNAVGMIVVEEILKTPMLRNNVAIDTWVVMPNHVHMIVEILPSEEMDFVETARCAVSQDVAILIPLPRLKPNSLGSIIGRIKAAAAWRIHKAGYRNFAWQERFHDSILRTDHAVENARSYVMMNPVVWHRDRNNVSL
jgi:REP element-mobilizing transposase RayT